MVEPVNRAPVDLSRLSLREYCDDISRNVTEFLSSWKEEPGERRKVAARGGTIRRNYGVGLLVEANLLRYFPRSRSPPRERERERESVHRCHSTSPTVKQRATPSGSESICRASENLQPLLSPVCSRSARENSLVQREIRIIN